MNLSETTEKEFAPLRILSRVLNEKDKQAPVLNPKYGKG